MLLDLLQTLKQKFDLKAVFLCFVIIGLFVPIEFTRAQELSYRDSDGDGFVDMQEYAYGTSFLLSDTDKDGLTDSEEIFDFGTNPLEFNKSIFSDGQELRFITPVRDDMARGGTLFFKGVSKYQNTSLYFNISLGEKVTKKEIKTDGRGIFTFEENLYEQCSFGTNYDVWINFLDHEVMRVHVTCEDITSLSFLEDAKFEGKSVSDIFAGVGDLKVTQGTSPVFFAHMSGGFSAIGVFRSTIFSSGLFVDNNKVPVVFKSESNLENGVHDFTLVLRDPKLKEVYAPLHIPFVVEGTQHSYLSSMVIYSSGGLLFGTVFGLLGGLLARIVKRRTRATVKVSVEE